VLSRVTLPQSSVLVGCRFPIIVVAFYCQGKLFVRPTSGFVLYPKQSSVRFCHLFRDSHWSFMWRSTGIQEWIRHLLFVKDCHFSKINKDLSKDKVVLLFFFWFVRGSFRHVLVCLYCIIASSFETATHTGDIFCLSFVLVRSSGSRPPSRGIIKVHAS